MMLCEKCGRYIGHICFPPIPTCTCNPEPLPDWLAEWLEAEEKE